ncbi:MAG: hypothetical protein DCF19_03915 [Pseudanabaena frigida]|uniref:Lipoprotein n=1 Tax=Pseudanabaena frigida TaxID=945775 RepID=A0A2W4WFA9_9CYAN|nr:MAG: hypothetical protein DCF19_03915 [Pseudanabaena frigida]
MQLPNRFDRYAFLSVTAVTMGLLLYGCGESKVSQCNKVVTVANKTKTLAVPKDVTGFVSLAENIDQIRIEVQAVAVQDSKLKELQVQLLGMYGDVSQALKAKAKATEAKDKNALDKAKQDLETSVGKENDIVDRLNALCTK